MTFGIKQFKNGKERGYIIFDSGKRITLNEKELNDFRQKIRFWQIEAVEKERII
jgi:hypothetical protein